MREATVFEKITCFLYALFTDYLLGMGAFLYSKFTINILNQTSIVTGIFWGIFIVIFLNRAVTNKMVSRKCYGKKSNRMSLIIQAVVVILASLIFGY